MTQRTPDDLCAEYAERGVRITVKPLPGDQTVVLIEGEREAFEFLGQLFLAHARGEDCGFQVSPNGPGNALFSQESALGLYLHCLPLR